MLQYMHPRGVQRHVHLRILDCLNCNICLTVSGVQGLGMTIFRVHVALLFAAKEALLLKAHTSHVTVHSSAQHACPQ